MSTETPTREYNKDTLKDTKLKSEALKELGEKQDDGKKLIDTDFGKKQLADKWMEKAGMGEDGKKAIYSFLDNYGNKTIIGNHENFVKAVKDFQSKNGLTADGVLGWKTLEAIDNSLTANKLDPKDNSKSRLADIESASRASKPAEGGIAKATASSLLSMSADLPNNDLALKEHTSLGELKNPLTPRTETAAKKNETLDPDDTKNLVYQDGKLYQRTGLPNYYKEVYLLKDGDKMVLKASGNPFSKSLSNLDGAKVVSLQDAQNIIDNDTGNKIAKTSKGFMQDKYIYIPEDIISKSLRNIKPKAKKTA